jgi:Ca-activated chloride channel family protein
MNRIVALALLSLAPLVWPSATGIAAAQDPVDTIKVDVHLIEVYATIYDGKGRYVDGLTRDKFQVFEDGKSQQISSFETGAQSVSCAVLLDTTGSMTEALPRVKNSIVKLIDGLGPDDSIAIYTFDEHLRVRQDFTKDKDSAKRAVLRTRAEGRTALFDALSEVAQDVSKRPGKKAMLVFTDGDDNASALSAAAAIARAKKVGIPLYAIAEGEALESPNLKKLLDDLSERTGGTSYEAKKASDIEEIFQKISRDLQHLYMLSYQPPSAASENDKKWRKIDVTVAGGKDFRIRAKEGYFPE